MLMCGSVTMYVYITVCFVYEYVHVCMSISRYIKVDLQQCFDRDYL